MWNNNLKGSGWSWPQHRPAKQASQANQSAPDDEDTNQLVEEMEPMFQPQDIMVSANYENRENEKDDFDTLSSTDCEDHEYMADQARLERANKHIDQLRNMTLLQSQQISELTQRLENNNRMLLEAEQKFVEEKQALLRARERDDSIFGARIKRLEAQLKLRESSVDPNLEEQKTKVSSSVQEESKSAWSSSNQEKSGCGSQARQGMPDGHPDWSQEEEQKGGVKVSKSQAALTNILAKAKAAVAQVNEHAQSKYGKYLCKTCGFTFKDKQEREKHRESLFHQKVYEYAEQWRNYCKLVASIDPNNKGMSLKNVKFTNIRAERFRSDQMGGYCHLCQLQWGHREGFVAHIKKFHNSVDFYELSTELQFKTRKAWTANFHAFPRYQTDNNVCAVCQTITHSGIDLHHHVLSNHVVLIQCKDCGILLEENIMNLHKDFKCNEQKTAKTAQQFSMRIMAMEKGLLPPHNPEAKKEKQLWDVFRDTLRDGQPEEFMVDE